MTLFFALLFMGLGDGAPFIQALWWVLALVEYHYEGWILYCAVMRHKQVHDLALQGKGPPMTKTQRLLSGATLVIGIPWDIGLNVIASLYFWELPFKLTARGIMGVTLAFPDGTGLSGRALAAAQAVWNFLARRQWLLSQRLEWLVYHTPDDPSNWRRRRALSFRMELLDNIDPGGIHRA